jgi:hypothetical protein
MNTFERIFDGIEIHSMIIFNELLIFHISTTTSYYDT